jgi:hypothetical protein
LQEICQKIGAVFLPLHSAFKQDDHHVAFEEQGERTVPLYRDPDHLSMAGSLRAGEFTLPNPFPNKITQNQTVGLPRSSSLSDR